MVLASFQTPRLHAAPTVNYSKWRARLRGGAGNGATLRKKITDVVVIPAKAGIQGLKNIGRQADSGCQLSLA